MRIRGFSTLNAAVKRTLVAVVWQSMVVCGASIYLTSRIASAAPDDLALCTKGPGKPAQLIAACTRALDGWFVSDSTRDNVLAARAYHYIDLSQPGTALQDLDIVLSNHPKWSRSLNDRCLAYIMLRRFKEAIVDCEKAINIDKKLSFAYKNKARAYAGAGNTASAISTLGEYLVNFPDDARVLLQRGEFREKLGQTGLAESDYREAIKRDPSLSAAKSGLGRLQVLRERAVAATQAQQSPATVPPSTAPVAAETKLVLEAIADPDSSLIQRAQTALGAIGYDGGNPDGVMGRRTRAAIAAYRQSRRLRADMPLDEAFVANLEAVAAENVRQIGRSKAEGEERAERERAAAEAKQKREVESRRLAEVEARAKAAEKARRDEEAARVATAVAEEKRLVAERKRLEAEHKRLAAEAAERARRETAAAKTEQLAEAEAEQQRASEAARQQEQAAAAELAERLLAEKQPPQLVPEIAATELAVAALKSEPLPVGPLTGNTVPSRIALVIGNGDYRHAPALPNPRNDAIDVTDLLTRMGFTVMDGTDLDRDVMEDLMIRFAKAASKAEVALAFYAGHGIQVDGTNYLIPVDAAIEDELDLRRLIKLDDMVRDTGRADRFGLVMVDACRDNPFEAALARSLGDVSRSAGPMRGLAQPKVPPRVLVAYATAATQTAADGSGRNSPFTAAILKHLGEPDDVRFVIGKIVEAVAEASQQRQRPDTWASLGSERIFLVKPEAVAEALDVQLTLAERKAVQRSLIRVGLYAGAEDGRFSPTVRRSIRDFQVRSGAAATGYLSVEQMVALYDDARFGGAPAPLPQIDISDLLGRSMTGDRDAALQWAKVFDRTYAAVPGVPKNMTQAASWYRKAAEAGSGEAALALGRLVRDGDGIEPDPAEAARWLRVAADAGAAEAQYALAQLYRDGTGVPADQAEAIRLFRLAAQSQSGEAIAQLRALKAWEAQ